MVLPGREWQLRPVAAVSRQWECRRLEALHRCASGAPVVVTTAEALAQRCIPPQVLERAALTLEVGGRYDAPGARRAADGRGLCPLRPGGGSRPVRHARRHPRCVLAGDGEARALRISSTTRSTRSVSSSSDTQRRSRNLERALLLPAAEVLPALGDAGAAEKLERIAAKLEKKGGADALREDAPRRRRAPAPGTLCRPGADRVLAAVYPQKITAADYLAPQTIVVAWGVRPHRREPEGLSVAAEGGRLHRARRRLARGRARGAGAERGRADGEARRLRPLSDGEPADRAGICSRPRALLQITAKQLSAYGGSLDTAATDLVHYLTGGYRVLVLCGGEVRAQQPAAAAGGAEDPGGARPRRVPPRSGRKRRRADHRRGTVRRVRVPGAAAGRADGGAAHSDGRRRRKSRRRVKDHQPAEAPVLHGSVPRATWWSMSTTASAASWPCMRMPVDGVEKDYIKIAYAGSDCLYVPATQLDLVSKYIGARRGQRARQAQQARRHRLGQGRRPKARKAAAKDLAEGLITLYAERAAPAGLRLLAGLPVAAGV